MKRKQQMPNPLDDSGVKDFIKGRVHTMMETPARQLGSVCNLSEYVENTIIYVAEWAFSEGFSLGWTVKTRIDEEETDSAETEINTIQ